MAKKRARDSKTAVATIAPTVDRAKAKLLRVAVCQLESHPALHASHVAYLEEPLVPESADVSLSGLAAKGLDLTQVQSECVSKYIAWQASRVPTVLRHLSTIDPLPDLVVFAEAAIPLSLLPDIALWSKQTGSAVLAGTHTLQGDSNARRTYKSLGIDENRLKKLMSESAVSVLPLIRAGRTTLVPKKVPSPFERPIIALPRSDESFAPHPIGNGVYLLPLICSEALSDPSSTRPWDIAAILSYDAKPSQFLPYITQQIKNRRFVVYCNDGRYGGSNVFALDDERFPNWFRTALPNGLPVGDSLLVIDINLRATTVQVATSTPDQALQVVRLASIIPAQAPAAIVSAELQAAAGLAEPEARSAILARLLDNGRADELQRTRIRHLLDLERRGSPSTAWWPSLGTDCITEGVGSLRELETQLCASTALKLDTLLSSPIATRSDVAPALLKMLNIARSSGIGAENVQLSAPPTFQRSVIDRDGDVRAILRFLDDRAATVLQVVGLPQIGKTVVVDKALAQSGMRSPVRIPLTATSSIDYVLYCLLGSSTTRRPPYDDPVAVAASNDMRDAFRRADLVVIERADHIFNHDNWNDELWPAFLGAVTESAKVVGARIIIETRRELAFDIKTQTEVQRQRILGLDRTLIDFGVELFDSQLRRVGLSPNVFGYDDKRTVVNKLGGHPLGIALAADVAFVDGIDAVVDALRNRKGFFLTFIADVIRDLSLSDHETTLLKLCGLARVAVPREVLLAAADFPASAAIRNLLKMAAFDYTDDGLITVASLLREHFDSSELPPEMRKAFHRAAASHLTSLAKKGPMALAIEAEYHARLAGLQRQSTTLGLADSALAAAQTLYDQQEYDTAFSALEHLIEVKPTTEVLKLAAFIEARRNRFDEALRYAEIAFSRNHRDTYLLSELAKLALTEFQHFNVADRLVGIARKAGVEDVSILIVEGRLHLRRGRLLEAAQTFVRACELTERNPWPYYYLGTTNMRLGDLDAAIDVFHSGEEFFHSKEVRNRNALSAIQTQLAVAYLFIDRVDLAEPIIQSLMKRTPENPEVIRAFAGLTIKKHGITEAHRALEELKRAKIRNNADKCQFHLIYGLFYLGIGDLARASDEFARASSADRSNVYVMIKWAKTLYEIGQARWLDGDDSHRMYLNDCAKLVKKILEYDINNREATSLAMALHNRFGIDI